MHHWLRGTYAPLSMHALIARICVYIQHVPMDAHFVRLKSCADVLMGWSLHVRLKRRVCSSVVRWSLFRSVAPSLSIWRRERSSEYDIDWTIGNPQLHSIYYPTPNPIPATAVCRRLIYFPSILLQLLLPASLHQLLFSDSLHLVFL